jgi:hypothetical protein
LIWSGQGDAGGIADLDPDEARPGLIGAIDLLRNDALSAEAACMRNGWAVLGYVFVKQYASLNIAQQPRQRNLTVEERKLRRSSPSCSIRSKA